MLRPQHFKCESNVGRSTPGLHQTALVLLAATLILDLSHFAGATTINANSASQSDVAAAIASAADGDIVLIPGGSVTWTRTLRVRKGITIQGAGVGVTIIKDAVQSGQLISWSLAAGLPSRLTGIEFQDGGRSTTANAPGGILRVDGSNTDGSSFRWDHCKWNDLNGFLVFDTVLGVVDHNSFVMGNHLSLIYVYGSNWNGQGPYGDGSWATPVNFGSSDFLFFEDNDFHNNNAVHESFATDALNGGRFVVRHNTIFNAQVSDHGTESGGRERGSRAMEVYNNTFTGMNIGDAPVGSRSSRLIIHDNTVSGYVNGGKFHLGVWRCFFPFGPWLGADGTNAWDVNEPNAFYTGSAASNSSGTSVVVSAANWATNQWAGYTIRRTSNKCNSNSVTFAWIQSNTSNTISYTDNGGYSTPPLAFCARDTLEIRKVDHALDQPGRGGGSLITGDPPVRPAGWNDQVTEPCYAWNNGQASFSPGPGVRAKVHYFNNTPMPGYTPYTYPHPLTKGLPLPKQTTPNATANSQHDPHKNRRPWGGKKTERKKAKTAKENRTNEMAEGQENPGN
jgi:hypothetical protein